MAVIGAFSAHWKRKKISDEGCHLLLGNQLYSTFANIVQDASVCKILKLLIHGI